MTYLNSPPKKAATTIIKSRRKRGVYTSRSRPLSASGGTQSFQILVKPGQVFGLIEGIASYSDPKDYVRAVVDGDIKALPRTGRVSELIGAVKPGHWTVSRRSVFRRLEPLDWEGQRVRLRHDFFLDDSSVKGTAELIGEVVNPSINCLLCLLDHQGIVAPHNIQNICAGSLTLAAFDGFVSWSDSCNRGGDVSRDILSRTVNNAFDGMESAPINHALVPVPLFETFAEAKSLASTQSGCMMIGGFDLSCKAYKLHVLRDKNTGHTVAVDIVFHAKLPHWSLKCLPDKRIVQKQSMYIPTLTQAHLKQHKDELLLGSSEDPVKRLWGYKKRKWNDVMNGEITAAKEQRKTRREDGKSNTEKNPDPNEDCTQRSSAWTSLNAAEVPTIKAVYKDRVALHKQHPSTEVLVIDRKDHFVSKAIFHNSIFTLTSTGNGLEEPASRTESLKPKTLFYDNKCDSAVVVFDESLIGATATVDNPFKEKDWFGIEKKCKECLGNIIGTLRPHFPSLHDVFYGVNDQEFVCELNTEDMAILDSAITHDDTNVAFHDLLFGYAQQDENAEPLGLLDESLSTSAVWDFVNAAVTLIVLLPLLLWTFEVLREVSIHSLDQSVVYAEVSRAEGS